MRVLSVAATSTHSHIANPQRGVHLANTRALAIDCNRQSHIGKSALAAAHLVLIFATFSALASLMRMNTALTRPQQQKPGLPERRSRPVWYAAFAQERYRIETVCADMALWKNRPRPCLKCSPWEVRGGLLFASACYRPSRHCIEQIQSSSTSSKQAIREPGETMSIHADRRHGDSAIRFLSPRSTTDATNPFDDALDERVTRSATRHSHFRQDGKRTYVPRPQHDPCHLVLRVTRDD